MAGLGDAQLVSANAIDSNNIIENLQTESMPIVANQENTNQEPKKQVLMQQMMITLLVQN